MDISHQELCLAQAKLAKLHQHLNWFKGRHNTTRHQFESLVGLLGHAASVVPPRRLFTIHPLDLLKISL